MFAQIKRPHEKKSTQSSGVVTQTFHNKSHSPEDSDTAKAQSKGKDLMEKGIFTDKSGPFPTWPLLLQQLINTLTKKIVIIVALTPILNILNSKDKLLAAAAHIQFNILQVQGQIVYELNTEEFKIPS